MNRRLRGIFLVLIVIVALGGFLFMNSLRKNPELDRTSTYLIQGKENLIAVYKDKLAIRIPYDINIDKEKTIRDLVKTGSEETVLESINRVLPEPLNNYMVIKYGEVKLNVKNQKNIQT